MGLNGLWRTVGFRVLATALVVAVGGAVLLLSSEAGASATCSIYWTGVVSSDWATAGNWSNSDGGASAGRLPGSSDFVCMSTAPKGSSVDLAAGESATIDGTNFATRGGVSPSLSIEGTLILGTTSAANDSTVANLTVANYGTVISVVTLTTAKISLGGNLGGSGVITVPAGGTMSIGYLALSGGQQIVNRGTATIAQGATVSIGDTSEIENAGQLALSDNAQVSVASPSYTGLIVNDAGATVSYAGSATSSSATIAVTFDNFGAVSVPRGVLYVNGGTSTDSLGDTGSYSSATTGAIVFGGGNRYFTSAVSFPGAGQITLSSYISVRQGTTLTMSNVLMSGATLAGRGTLTIPAGGNADLASLTLIGGFRIINKGQLTVAAIAQISFTDSSEIENTATMTLADSAEVGWGNVTDGFLVNDSGATIGYTGSASSASTSVQVPFDNFGTVNVVRGALSLSGNSSDSLGDTGVYNVGASGSLGLGGYRSFQPSVTLPGVGQVTVSGTLHLPKGTALSAPNLLLSGGQLDGRGSLSIPANALGTFSGGTLSGGVRVINRGSLTIATNTTTAFSDQSTLENAGTLNLSDGATLGGYQSYGTVVNDSGASTNYTGSATNSQSSVVIEFDNFGSVSVGRGTLTFAEGGSANSAGDSGSYSVAGQAFLTFQGTRVFARSASFPGAGQITDNGWLDFLGSETLQNLVWSGAVEVAAGMTVTASVTGSASGSLDLDGDRPGHYGTFLANGSLTLAGLGLNLSNPGFTPPCGQLITALRAGSLTGQFNNWTISALPPNGSLVPSYTATTAKALVSCPVPPVPVSQTYGLGRGLDIRNPSGYYAEPVNTATGAYSTQQSDGSIAGPGAAFDFTRYYSSDNGSNGPLGPGWTDSYSASLSQQGPTVYMTSENGQQLAFDQQPDGSWLGEASVTSRLTQTSTGWLVTRKDRTVLTFDTSGVLQSIKDENGSGVTLAYDGSGQLATATNTSGRVVTFAYTNGQLTSMTLPLSRTVKYSYDTTGHLASVTDAAAEATQYGYDSNGLLTTIVDGNGHATVTNTYDPNGRVITQVNADNKVSHFAYDTTNQVTTYTDARGNKWKDYYSQNALIKRVDPLGEATSYAYDANLNTTGVTSPRGFTTLRDYDSNGNLLDQTAPSPLGYEQTWTYNSLNEPLTYRDGRGLQTKYSYDPRGNLLKVTRPDGSTISHTYFADGVLRSTTTPGNETTSYAIDTAGDAIRETSPLGEVTSYGYDAAGRRTSSVSPLGDVSGGTPSQYMTRYSYDAEDRLTATTDPLGKATRVAYDKAGNRTSVTDKNGHRTQYTYDAANHVATVQTADGKSTTYGYDANGNLGSARDANLHTTKYSYDAANRLTSTTTPLGHVTRYTYDADGNTATVTDPIGVAAGSGGVTTYGYDQLDRVTTASYSDGTPTVSYTYDADSDRASMSDRAGKVLYSYDSLGQLLKRARGTSTFSYLYTPDGQVKTRTYPSGTTITNAYDSDQRLKSVSQGGATTTYAYDADGNLTSTTYPSSTGVMETRTYDHADRLASIQASKGASTIDSYQITRDAYGNPTGITTPSGAIAYTYDTRNRVTSACFGASCATENEAWTYDGVGNRLTATINGTTTTNTYNADNQLSQTVTGTTTITPTYDLDGRQTAYGTNTYAWNVPGQLTSATVTPPTGPTPAIGTAAIAGFTRRTSTLSTTPTQTSRALRTPAAHGGHPHRRTTAVLTMHSTPCSGVSARAPRCAKPAARSTRDNPASRSGLAPAPGSTSPVTTTITYDGDGNRLTATIGASTTQYSWDTNAPNAQLATLTPGSGAAQNYVWGQGEIGFSTSNGSFYTLHDDQNSAVGLIASDGTLQSATQYDPYGTILNSTPPVAGAPANAAAWQGQILDTSGQYDLRAREYDTGTGQFLSQDPVTPSPSQPLISPYLYAGDQPTLMQDPSGMFSLTAAWSGIQSGLESGYTQFTGLAGDAVKSTVGDIVTGVETGWNVGSTLSTCWGDWSSQECGRSIQETGVGISEALVGGVCDLLGPWGAIPCNAAVAAGGQWLLDRYGIKVPGDTTYGDRRLGYTWK